MNTTTRGTHHALLRKLTNQAADDLTCRTERLCRLFMGQANLTAGCALGLCQQKFCQTLVGGGKEHLLKPPQHLRETVNGALIGQQPRVDVLLENLMADPHLRAE